MKTQNKLSKGKRNYYVDVAALLPVLMLLFTGIVMLMYHTGKPYSETTLSQDRDCWLNAHILFAVISMVMIGGHLSLHLSWFKKLISGRLKNKYWVRNLILVIVFLLATLTAVIPWLILEDSKSAEMMLGIHNKLGILLTLFFVVHLLGYSKWLVSMTKKVISE